MDAYTISSYLGLVDGEYRVVESEILHLNIPPQVNIKTVSNSRLKIDNRTRPCKLELERLIVKNRRIITQWRCYERDLISRINSITPHNAMATQRDLSIDVAIVGTMDMLKLMFMTRNEVVKLGDLRLTYEKTLKGVAYRVTRTPMSYTIKSKALDLGAASAVDELLKITNLTNVAVSIGSSTIPTLAVKQAMTSALGIGSPITFTYSPETPPFPFTLDGEWVDVDELPNDRIEIENGMWRTVAGATSLTKALDIRPTIRRLGSKTQNVTMGEKTIKYTIRNNRVDNASTWIPMPNIPLPSRTAMMNVGSVSIVNYHQAS